MNCQHTLVYLNSLILIILRAVISNEVRDLLKSAGCQLLEILHCVQDDENLTVIPNAMRDLLNVALYLHLGVTALG
ncbi:Uncharacterised protein [Legionella quateirensis]|uniref:Uncharacterized protein n=1 Tax=Legionella quateirensis TaxID=45072 RepID=A0A378KR06_9GAMM|nr:hypothetical protein [Legionella quateirensis]STY17005.1 Uncharacterised protein [Legionella quateirensis]